MNPNVYSHLNGMNSAFCGALPEFRDTAISTVLVSQGWLVQNTPA